jgi:hypothetical protein
MPPVGKTLQMGFLSCRSRDALRRLGRSTRSTRDAAWRGRARRRFRVL